jgi:hypothetical protein
MVDSADGCFHANSCCWLMRSRALLIRSVAAGMAAAAGMQGMLMSRLVADVGMTGAARDVRGCCCCGWLLLL